MIGALPFFFYTWTAWTLSDNWAARVQHMPSIPTYLIFNRGPLTSVLRKTINKRASHAFCVWMHFSLYMCVQCECVRGESTRQVLQKDGESVLEVR